jgi:SAM-dependent methyltransferase
VLQLPRDPSFSMRHRYHIKFPPADSQALGQNEVFFYLQENGGEARFRFHDYDAIYSRPGLYEQIFYDRLKCSSPTKVGEILKKAMDANGWALTESRVLDLGAGNGIMGEVLKKHGVARLIGADIIEEAKDAVNRDRPDLYDEYYVADFTNLDEDLREELQEWQIDVLTCVAALGFDDIPARAFLEALRLVRNDGWVAFNIKESFLDKTDNSGFSSFIRELIFSEYIDIHHLERYRHRLSMEGLPLYYFALVARKVADIPADFLERIGVES